MSAQENCYIVRNNATLVAYDYSLIDSITHSYYQEGHLCHSIWIDGYAEHIPINTIDSVCFDIPNNCMVEIPEQMLGDWDEGMVFGSNLVLCKKSPSLDFTILYYNNKNNDVKDGLIVTLDENGQIITFGNLDHFFYVNTSDNGISVHLENSNHEYEHLLFENQIPKRAQLLSRKETKKIDLLGQIIGCAATLRDIYEQCLIGSVSYAITSPNLYEEILTVLGDKLEIGMPKVPLISILIDINNGNWTALALDLVLTSIPDVSTAYFAYNIIEAGLYKIIEHTLYGEAEVSIDNIEYHNSSYIVTVTLDKAYTIPDVFHNPVTGECVMNPHITGEPLYNFVECGVYVRKQYDYVTEFYHDYQSRDFQIEMVDEKMKENGTVQLTFNIPIIEKEGITLYFRPYLKSLIEDDLYWLKNNVTCFKINLDPDKGFVRYGIPIPYKVFNGEIIDFTQYPSQYIKDEGNDGIIKFNTNFHAIINTLEDTEEWGVYIVPDENISPSDISADELYYYYHPSHDKAAKLEDWIDVECNVRKSHLDILDYDNLVASKKIKAKLYRKRINSASGEYVHSEDLYEFELKYGVPKAITAEQELVESQSAIVRCLYKDFVLWNGECGIEYYSNNDEKMEMTITPPEGEVQAIYLSDLKPNTTYEYRAFIKIGDKYYWAEEKKSFTTKAFEVKELYATDIKATSAKLVSTVENYNPSVEGVSIAYFYSSDEDVMNSESRESVIATYDGDDKFNADITDLTDYTNYYYVLAVKQGDGEYEPCAFKSFKTLPMVTTSENPAVTYYSATLQGICTKGLTIAGFSLKKETDLDYSPYGASVDENGNISATIDALTANTKYSYHVFVEDENGTYLGEVREFTTQPLPVFVFTNDVTNIKTTSATLTGIVENYDPMDESVILAFKYSTDADVLNSDNGISVVATYDGEGGVTANIAGLKDYTTYYYTLTVKRGDGDVNPSEIKSFKTNPMVTTNEDPNTTENSAFLEGTCSKGITSAGFAIREEGEDIYTSYDALIDEIGNIYTTIESLEADTKYYYYAFVEDENGTYPGDVHEFTTQPLPVIVYTDEAFDFTATTATLTGTVENYDPTDENVILSFKYSTDADVLNSANGTSVVASYDGEGGVTANIAGLKDYTTYYYTLTVKRGDGDLMTSIIKSFRTNPIVTTLENPTASSNSVTLHGTCSKGITVAGFSIKKNGESGYTQYGAVPDANGNFSATIDGLDALTAYSYYAFVQVDEKSFPGAECHFSTTQPPVTYSTGEATAVNATTAILNGTVNYYDPNDEYVNFKFFYHTDENVFNGKSVTPTYDGNIIMTASISDLKDYTTYYYALAAKQGDADYLSHNVESFKTLPVVATLNNASTTSNSVTLQGTCSKGITITGFAVRKNGTSSYTQYGANVDEDGNFSATIDGLDAATTYSYYGFVKADNQTFMGETLTFTTEQPQLHLCPDNNHPHLIDLGLPSGTKWACCNVGANAPEEYGGYYAWGETEEKSIISAENYVHWPDYNGGGYYYGDADMVNIGSEISATIYDTATSNWGAPWCMPTMGQCQELVWNCNFSRVTINGINGTLFVGETGNSIFLPNAGAKMSEVYDNDQGFYWSGTLAPFDNGEYSHIYNAYLLTTSDNWAFSEDMASRYTGRSIRPIQSGVKVTTGDPTDINSTSVMLNGMVENLEMVTESVKFAFLYSTSPEIVNSSDCKIVVATNDSEGHLTAEIGDLNDFTIYYYVAAYTLGDADNIFDYILGGVKTFIKPLCPDDHHPHMIDLGLPSGTKWACCNVGASKPEDYGEYYMYGQVKNAPTIEQFHELINKCSYQWIKYNGINGNGIYGNLFMGSNGQAIFLPAGGKYFNAGQLGLLYVGEYGEYWSSSPWIEEGVLNTDKMASLFEFSEYHVADDCWDMREDGLSVRPVSK